MNEYLIANFEIICGRNGDFVGIYGYVTVYNILLLAQLPIIGTNNANPREGWYVDDIKVQGCGTEVIDDTIFDNGFDP